MAHPAPKRTAKTDAAKPKPSLADVTDDTDTDRVSLHPLKPVDALRALLRTKPAKR